MTKAFWSVTEVLELFEVEEKFLNDLETEEIVCATCDPGLPSRGFDVHQLEKLRIAKVLMEDMEVNLPGVEVILQLRQNLIEMRSQFDAIMEDMSKHLRETFEQEI